MRPRNVLDGLRRLTRREKAERLEHEIVTDGLIAPLRYLPNQTRSQESWTAETGVYTKRGKVVQNSLLFRNDKWLGFAGQFDAEGTKPGSVIYLGPLFDHFGHFLLEGLARLWCARDFPNHKLAWSAPMGSDQTTLKPWQQELLAELGVARDVILVAKPTRFAEIIVPNAGFKIQSYFHPGYAAFLDRVGTKYVPKSKTNIWLSRSRIEDGMGLIGSDLLETRLEQAGWKIIYPETMTVSEQFQAISQANRIAGEVGSALHLPMFLAKAKGLQIDVFPRRRFARTVRNSFPLIADRKGFKQTIHDLPDERILQESEAHVTRIGQNFAPYLQALDIPLPSETPSRAPCPSAKALNTVLGDVAGATRYLQIGWADDGRYFDVVPQVGDLVCDIPAIDPRVLEHPSRKLFEMRINDFFEHFAAEQPKYDLIHIVDSLQMEILKRSVELGHSGTVWVLDHDLDLEQQRRLEKEFPQLKAAANALGFGAFLRRAKAIS